MDICTKFGFNLQRGFKKDWNGKKYEDDRLM
jgi:hypothetical protein